MLSQVDRDRADGLLHAAVLLVPDVHRPRGGRRAAARERAAPRHRELRGLANPSNCQGTKVQLKTEEKCVAYKGTVWEEDGVKYTVQ